MRYYCIEAPCCYQNPKPELVLLWSSESFYCPFCERIYTPEILEKLFPNAN